MQLFSLITIFRFLFHLYLLNKLSLLVWGVSSPLSSFLGVSSPLSSFLGVSSPLSPFLGVSSPLSGRRWSCSATRNGCQGFWILWDPGDWRSSTPNVFQSNTWWSTGCAVKLSSFWGGRGVGLPPPGTGVSLILGGALAPRLGCRARGVARGGLKQKIVMSAQSNGEVFQKNIIL